MSVQRLSELRDLPRGWHDGDGEEIAEDALGIAAEFLGEIGDEVERVAIFPTLAGGVSLADQKGSARWSLEIEPGGDLFYVEVAPDHTESGEPASINAAADMVRAFVRARF